MTTNYHTAIASGAAANASTFNAPLSQLDSALSAVIGGGDGIDQLNLGAETTLTIASGVITVTGSRHQIETEGSASSDDLAQIDGGAVGDVLFLRSVSSSRVPTLLHDATKIFLAGRQNLALDSEYMVVELQCIATTPNCLWVQVNQPMALSAGTANTTLRYFRDIAAMPSYAVRNHFEVKAAAATIAFNGVATPTLAGTASASNTTTGTYINLVSGAAAGNAAGYFSATINLIRTGFKPKFTIVIETGAAADIANIRYWIGLCTLAPTNVDTFAGVQNFLGFRYSTVIGDSGFVPVACDGTTQTVGSMVANGSIVASTRYLLQFSADGAGNATFSINNGATTTLSANVPATTQDMGYAFYLITTAAVAKNFKFGRLSVEYD